MESGDEEEIMIKLSESSLKESQEPEVIHWMITRSKALIDAMHSSDSEDDEESGLMVTNQVEESEPTSFEGAWNHHNHEKRKSWREAIRKELNSMKQYNVWEVVDKNDITSVRAPIGNKCIFKEKSDGKFQARLIAIWKGKMLKLNKSMYGLVQAVRQWYKQF